MDNLNKKGYILNGKNEIETLTYKDYLSTYGADETTTGKGVGPRLYVEGNTIMTWGVKGNNHKMFATFANKREATNKLWEIWEQNAVDNWDAPRFFNTKKALYEDFAESNGRSVAVVKRYFRIKDTIQANFIKMKNEKEEQRARRPIFSVQNMTEFIENNREMIQTSLNELNELKQSENKTDWQIKANSLIQKVSNNDFRALNWKEIYNLIKSRF